MSGRCSDESNERIKDFVYNELAKFMAKENRGFVFAPVYQEEGNHKSFCCVYTDSTQELWVTLVSIIDNVNRNIPEDSMEQFKQEFIAFIRTTIDVCFPSLSMVDAKDIMKGE